MYDPNYVFFQTMNEPRLTKYWRAGTLSGTTGNRVIKVVDANNVTKLKISENAADQATDVRTVDSSVWTAYQQDLVRTIRSKEGSGKNFTIIASNPINETTTFKTFADIIASGITVNSSMFDNQVISEGALTDFRGYDTTAALAQQSVVTSKTGPQTAYTADGNVVYNFHYYAQGTFTVNQGNWTNDSSFDAVRRRFGYLPYAVPTAPAGVTYGTVTGSSTQLPSDFNSATPSAHTLTLKAALDVNLARWGLTKNSSTYDATGSVTSAMSQEVKDRRSLIRSYYAGSATAVDATNSAVSANVVDYFNTAIKPLVIEYFQETLYTGAKGQAPIAADMQEAATWANASARSVYGKNAPVIADEFGINFWSWQYLKEYVAGQTTYKDVRLYARPFADVPNDRLNWLTDVRNALNTQGFGGSSWDYGDGLSITEPDIGTASYATIDQNDTSFKSYRRKLASNVATALGTSGFGLYSSVSGRVYVDSNANGVYDAGEERAGRTVTLKLGSTTVATATTSKSGEYVFSDAAVNNYTVSVTVNSGETNQSGVPAANVAAATDELTGRDFRLTVSANPIASPTLTSTTVLSGGYGVRVNWTYGTGTVTGFRVERRLGTAGTWAAVMYGDSLASSTRSFDDWTGMNPNTTYSYRVNALMSSGESDPSNVLTVTTTP